MRFHHVGIPTAGRFEGEIDLPHVAFEVENLHEALEGHEVIIAPNSPSPWRSGRVHRGGRRPRRAARDRTGGPPMTRALWAAAVIVLAGCGPEEVLGRVSAVEAPDTVQAEQRFSVTVTTRGPDGCWRKERTEVKVSGLTATISPYDVDTGGVCTQATVEITHLAELRFARAGVGLIRVLGRDGTGRELSVVVK